MHDELRESIEGAASVVEIVEEHQTTAEDRQLSASSQPHEGDQWRKRWTNRIRGWTLISNKEEDGENSGRTIGTTVEDVESSVVGMEEGSEKKLINSRRSKTDY